MYKRFSALLKPYRLHIAGASLCAFLNSATFLAIPLLVGGLVDEIIESQDIHRLSWLAIGGVILIIIKGMAWYCQSYLSFFTGYKVVVNLRQKLYEHLQSLPLNFFHTWRTGEITSRVLNDVNVIEHTINVDLVRFTERILTLAGAIGLLFYINWRLALATMVVLPAMTWTASRFGGRMRKISTSLQSKLADISSILYETISGIRIVKSFNMEKAEIERFGAENRKNFGILLKSARILSLQEPILLLIAGLGLLFVLWYGGREVVAGKLTLGDLTAFLGFIGLAIDPLTALAKINLAFQRISAAGKRIFDLMDMKSEIKELPDAIELPDIGGEVTFEKVHFSYDGNKQVIQGIDFSVPSGQVIALVGASGVGKTTLVNLIPRFYDPIKGKVKIDGYDIKLLKFSSLRRQIGIVPQETILFSTTVKENIAYGKPGALEDEIIDAAKAANAHDFITKLPKGYDTLVGEKGAKLSGGERQRIAIARAILHQPKILILDEATSELDAESEVLVQEALDRLMQGRTTFIIAHRLSTIINADRIVVIDNGRIVEQGTHGELMAKGDTYTKLYRMQYAIQDQKSEMRDAPKGSVSS